MSALLGMARAAVAAAPARIAAEVIESPCATPAAEAAT
eukprot:CAMPEP_0115831002 /NCGR_PEP_ID=MMETSP0287-20121206/1912_1 /TAXON_ID=412157 /ORGANISM="Chrysochromulina rotalis, Strain UIO044" /LENGTH=37 /DNA_ID= /DNA_START= /DNA_END= /DNA_ORIENTATION=